MKKIGIVVFVFGLICLFAALSMDTSVSAFGGRVNNLGLMNDKQNYLLVSVAVTIMGVIVWVFGGRSTRQEDSSQGSPKISDPDQVTRTCPFCAEQIKAKAIVCRYCNREVKPIDVEVLDQSNKAANTEMAKGQLSAGLGSAFDVIRDVVEKATRELLKLNIPYKKILKIVLAFFAIVIVVGLLGNLLPSKDEANAKADINNLMLGLKKYRFDNSHYPTAAQGLEALATEPATEPRPPNWKVYIDTLPTDPWGNPYLYLNPGVKSEVDVMSLGADGRPGGSGKDADIGSWER